jgi:hypothetical protein
MRTENTINGIICIHVDDFLHAGDSKFEQQIVNQITQRFIAGKVEESCFKYIGFNVSQSPSGITMDQTAFEDTPNEYLSTHRMSQKENMLNNKELTILRQIVGRLNWFVQGSRPDLAFATIELSTKLKNGCVNDLMKGLKIIRRLHDVESKVFFPTLKEPMKDWTLVLFTDAAHANICNGTGSMGAHILFLADNQGNSCVCPGRLTK